MSFWFWSIPCQSTRLVEYLVANFSMRWKLCLALCQSADQVKHLVAKLSMRSEYWSLSSQYADLVEHLVARSPMGVELITLLRRLWILSTYWNLLNLDSIFISQISWISLKPGRFWDISEHFWLRISYGIFDSGVLEFWSPLNSPPRRSLSSFKILLDLCHSVLVDVLFSCFQN